MNTVHKAMGTRLERPWLEFKVLYGVMEMRLHIKNPYFTRCELMGIFLRRSKLQLFYTYRF